MIRRPPRSTRTDTLFPTRRSSDLRKVDAAHSIDAEAGRGEQDHEQRGYLQRQQIGAEHSGARAEQHESENQAAGGRVARSEEHTSELQSLMRISYAVFCLKKKKTNTIIQIHTITN